MIKKAFTGAAALLLTAGVVFAQEKTNSKAAVKSSAKKTTAAAACKPGENGKSCCKQPSKTANLRLAAATRQKAKKD
jgi:hypothetical protein